MREERKNELLLSFHSWAGPSPPPPRAILCPSNQSHFSVLLAKSPFLSSTTTEATGPCLKLLNQVLLPQFQMMLCVRTVFILVVYLKQDNGVPPWMWLGKPLTQAAVVLCLLYIPLTLRGEARQIGFFSVRHNFLFLEPGLRMLPLIKEVLRGTSNAVGCGAKGAVSPCRWCPICSLHLTTVQGFGGCRLPPEVGSRSRGMRGDDSRITEVYLNYGVGNFCVRESLLVSIVKLLVNATHLHISLWSVSAFILTLSTVELSHKSPGV